MLLDFFNPSHPLLLSLLSLYFLSSFLFSQTSHNSMAACGSLQHIFDNPLPENPTLLESLSPWSQIKTVKSLDRQPSFTEIFGELHFKENSPSSNGNCHRRSKTFSAMNTESLQLCTEGLGVESSNNVVQDLKEEEKPNGSALKHIPTQQSSCGEFRRARTSGGPSYPPPISCIGESGKPRVCFKKNRRDGRLVLTEVRIPTKEFLHASREDGRLRMHFVHPNNDKILEEVEHEDEEEEEDEVDLLDEEEEEEAQKNEENLP